MATVHRINGTMRPSAQAFIDDAERLLELARVCEKSDDSVVYSYRAALRAAGALIEWAMHKRKRYPKGSAWDKLRKLDPSMSTWAAHFEAHARLASRAGMGLERGVDPTVAEQIYRQACELVDVARGRLGYMPDVA
ncbi:SAV_6107 family HEPN domain-containing protein [Corynebacterium anserum]|uniref:SAV-6107-like HEPN domain-containing protein n=1 Tax=Corynebacterium anserum TaxID=2684406 RepID=A0A7G7YMX6_9CORY|nr:SAV_6107 family HEPN domain-containing protein [Corynebacterium anserum]MBC2680923.1 hypothetical protein [Corynebacterium anserum]QNH95846.1 hypothetical protein GP473_03390 [Corynebacterium anserum]